jgi:glycine cleavage system T protein
MEIKRTALYDAHVASGGKMVEFAGFMMPIQYKGIVAEHNAVRESSGMFDVSHMGEIEIAGKDAMKTVQRYTTNDISTMNIGEVKYSPMCNENGGVVDDLLVYKMEDDNYILVVNASNIEKDYKFMYDNNIYDAKITNLSDTISQIAIQGPKSEEIIKKVIGKNLPEKYYTFTLVDIDGNNCILSRTGYTGEDGFEVYCPNKIVVKIWNELIEAGGEDIMPCGLGCRDTLRFEASMPLYGHEMTEEITPVEAALKFFIKIEEGNDFIGRSVIEKQIEEGITRRRCGIEILDRGIAREGAEIYYGDKKVGFVTSGTKTLTVGKTMAMALVERPYNKRDTELTILVRDKKLSSKVVNMPFYKRAK